MHNRPTILIVDDEPGSIGIFTRALLGEYRVIFAKNGPDALTLVAREIPDLIILDVVMADMNGYQLFRQMQADERLQNVPMIFLSSRRQEEDERIGLELGAMDYWTKPVSIDIARIRVRNHLELKRHRDLLAQLAATDELCAIANRRGMEQCLQQEWRRCARNGKPLAVIMTDIDHFKAYNDHYGHPAGDGCLRQVAKLIAGALTRPADLATRFGGEEFVCILPETDLDGAISKAETIRTQIERAAIPHSTSPTGSVTLSLGVACMVPDLSLNHAVVIERADRALYRAKTSGRNRVDCWREA